MIEIEGLIQVFNRRAANEVVALRNVSVTFQPGEFVTVVGANGAGKSTFLNALSGVYVSDEGAIRIDGLDVSKTPEHVRARQIGRVFQNPLDGSAGSLSVEENLTLALLRSSPRTLRFAITQRRRAEVRDELSRLRMGLEDRLSVPVRLLSGGQRQALALLMAGVCRPKLLLLDEHLAALDPIVAQVVLDLTCRLSKEWGSTTLMVTHNMEQALRVGDRTLLMHAGQILLDFHGEARARMTVRQLVEEFHRARGEVLADDRLLLA